MRNYLLISLVLLISCNPKKKELQFKTSENLSESNCEYYQEGLDYFKQNYFGDYMNNGSRDTAISIFEKAVEAGCQEFDLYYKLYFCYEWEGDNKNAEKYLSLAIQVDSTDLELYYWRGELNMRLKDLKQALEDFQKFISTNDKQNLRHGYYRCGAILYAMGDTINSKIYMKKAVELNEGKELRDFHDFGKSWDMIEE